MLKFERMILVYDDSFEGFLSVVFECYLRKINPDDILSSANFQKSMFTTYEKIPTNPENADRVWNGLQKKMDHVTRHVPFTAFLSRDPGIEMALLRFMQMAFAAKQPISGNFGDPDVLNVRKTSRKVMQESRRMVQFIRFQLTRDNIYFAAMSPDYDVLPIAMHHFRDRFADQTWLIYDLRRDYGFFYDQKTMEEVVLKDKIFNASDGSVSPDMLQEGETLYQSMWNGYCRHVTIRERLNLRLQRQHMPGRYWKFLPEKKPFFPE
jgi:probable DNA metabolism protein